MTDQPHPTDDTDDTPLADLNDDGVGGTLGADNTFEPEEEPEAPVETDGV